MKLREKDIENDILTWLNLQSGCFAFKVNTGGYFDPNIGRFRRNLSPFLIRGTSDIIAVWEGLFIAIEVKTSTGFKTFQLQKEEHVQNQKAFLDKVKENAGIGIVTYSLEHLKKELSAWVDSVKAIPMPASRLNC